MKELVLIQSKLKAPKGQYNSFGKYKYRNCEDILEAVKPLLNENGCTLTISDEIVMVGDRIYVKATAVIKNEKGESETVTAFAREELNKKGMDASQVTGATSSYARKYALNGLFCIDDTKDADSMDNTKADPMESAKAELANCNDRESIERVWKSHKDLQPNDAFVKACQERALELTAA